MSMNSSLQFTCHWVSARKISRPPSSPTDKQTGLLTVPHAHVDSLGPFRGMFRHVRVDVFPPSINCRTSVVHARFPRAHQLNVHNFGLRVLPNFIYLLVPAREIDWAITHPFDSVQIVICADVVFCLPTVPDDVLSCE